MPTTLRTLQAIAVLTLLAALGAACAPSAPVDSENLAGADENAGKAELGITGNVAVGTSLRTTANLNLRSGASTSHSVRHVIPNGSTVTVERSSPQNGFYNVKHGGTTGWAHGSYLVVANGGGSGGGSGSPSGGSSSSARDAAMVRAQAGVGFSYWWGHGRFHPNGPTASTRGSCSGSCPNCSHSGAYGGDCSGYAAKVWAVPSSNTNLTTDSHPYSTADFNRNTSLWSSISRGNVRKADAMVYRSGGAGHMFIYSHGDAWGSMYAYECKGCSAGCVKGFRTASSSYKAIRRAGW